MEKINLDFTNIPDIEQKKGMILKYDHDFNSILSTLPNVLNRAWSSMKFSTQITGTIEGSSFLRAALVDFVGIEEMLKIDCPSKQNSCKIIKSTSPLLRFMKELRNYEVHVGTNKISKIDLDVYHTSDPNEIIEWDVPVIDNLSVIEFMKLDCCRKYKIYDKIEVKSMISYFEDAQKEWGVAFLIRKGINQYLSEIDRKINAT